MKQCNHCTREIQAYSSNSYKELDYRKSYWFHHWITKKRALIENEKGELLEANYNEFRFKPTNIKEDETITCNTCNGTGKIKQDEISI